MDLTENQISVELIRYYQQKDALVKKEAEYQELDNVKAYHELMSFYNRKISELKKKLYEINPKKLEEIVSKRENENGINQPRKVGVSSIKDIK